MSSVGIAPVSLDNRGSPIRLNGFCPWTWAHCQLLYWPLSRRSLWEIPSLRTWLKSDRSTKPCCLNQRDRFKLPISRRIESSKHKRGWIGGRESSARIWFRRRTIVPDLLVIRNAKYQPEVDRIQIGRPQVFSAYWPRSVSEVLDSNFVWAVVLTLF